MLNHPACTCMHFSVPPDCRHEYALLCSAVCISGPGPLDIATAASDSENSCTRHPTRQHMPGWFAACPIRSLNPVLTQQTPGFLSGLPGSLLFFWCHDSFFLFFPVTFSFFGHDDSPGNLWGDLQPSTVRPGRPSRAVVIRSELPIRSR